MTPKEKAQKLVDIYLLTGYGVIHDSFAKQCALVAVNEILEATKTKYKWGGGSPEKLVHFEEVKYDTYWQEVEQEIQAL